MNQNLEVEFIGSLFKPKFNELKKFFELEGAIKNAKKRISFMYFRDKIPKEFSELKNEDLDLRIRITNKNPELILKKGLFTGSHSRKEISIKFGLFEII